MKNLISYLKEKKKESILAPLFKMLEACFELIIPLIVARMIDEGVQGGNRRLVVLLCGQMILMGVLGLVFAVIAQYFAAKAALGCGEGLRNDLFRHINRLSYREIDRLGTSTLITRMTSDINQVQNGVNMFLRLFLRSPFVVFGALVMAFVVNRKISLIFLIMILVLSVIVALILKFSVPRNQAVQNRLASVLQKARENIQGVRVVRAFRRQNKEEQEFDTASGDLYHAMRRAGRLSSFLNPLTFAVVNLSIAALLMRGGNMVNTGELTRGDVVALVNYMSQILIELVKLANLIILLAKAMASLRQIDQIFQVEPSMEDPDTGEQLFDGFRSMEFRNVSFSYHEDSDPALEHISFRLNKGQIVGIIGGTGSGKSTLVRLMPRFYDVTDGEILINGKPVSSYQRNSLQRQFGVVPQHAVLFSGTLKDNLLWGKADASEEDMMEALTIAQGADFVREKGEGLQLDVSQGGKNFSGGQRQRLTIARAVLRKPEVLILDDSLSALDYATDAALRRALRKDAPASLVILVSQRLSTIRDADLILVLDNGMLAGQGTHEELLRTCKVYQDICHSQENRQ